jgi:hypothetical protein
VAASVFSSPTGGTTFLALTGVASITTGTSALSPTKQQACAQLVSGLIRCWGDNSQGEIGDGTTANRARPTTVNSFAANVDPNVTLRNERHAEVTVLINCEAGGRAHILLMLEQESTLGEQRTTTACQDRLVAVPLKVASRGLRSFEPGDATARVRAIVRDGDGSVVEDTQWTRQVTVSTAESAMVLATPAQ